MLPLQSVRTGLVLSLWGLVFSIASTLPVSAQAIVRNGPESALLGPRMGEEVRPSISANATGGFIVWEDNTIEGPSGRGIAGSVLKPDLTVSGAPFRINTVTNGNQEKPRSVLLSGGGAFVAWESRAGGKQTVNGRLLTANGGFGSGEFQISPATVITNFKRQVKLDGIFSNKAKTRTYKFKETISTVREHAGGISLAALPDGGTAVFYHGVKRAYTNSWTLKRFTKWNGVRTKTNDVLVPARYARDWMQDVYMQRYDAAGAKFGGEIQVNQYDTYNQRDPSATLLANGNLLVTWVSERPVSWQPLDNFTVSLYAREIGIDGTPVGDEFMVGTDSQRASANPVVTALGDGFAIYWSQLQHTQVVSPNWDVYGRVFASADQPAGDVFRVNLHTERDQFAPQVVVSGSTQVIVWTSKGEDGSREGVYARAMAAGVPTGEELRVNTTLPSNQHHPSISAVGNNRVLAVWSGYTGATGFNLFSQTIAGNPAAQ